MLYIRIGLGSTFQLKETILYFSTDFIQKEYAQSKTKKVSIAIEYLILELVNVPKFTLNKAF